MRTEKAIKPPKIDYQLTFKYVIDNQWVRLEYYEDQFLGIHVKTISKINLPTE